MAVLYSRLQRNCRTTNRESLPYIHIVVAGCTPVDVSAHYSSLALALAAINVSAGVTFESANRFYVDESVRTATFYFDLMTYSD